MPDKPKYEDHESQPLHRPGMEGVVNRGSDARDASGNRTSDSRPTVGAGKADPFAVDAAQQTEAPKAPPKAPVPATPGDGSGAGGRQREQTVMDTVDKAVTGQP